MQIASITTNEQGEYEYATEEDYLEQTLDIIIQKEGFERKNISYEIDKAEIKSDILLNELEKGTKEKTRIFGTIRNSKNRDPVKAASITLSIEGTQIASVSSNEQGEYEYTAEEDYTGQTLDYVIQKEGFIRKDISYEIERFEIESDFMMDEIEIEIKGKICDETDSPLDNASISFSIGGSTIDLASDKDGSFSFTIGQQFLNQTIGYEANKEGFKIKSGKLKLIQDLRCINLSELIPDPNPDPNRWIKVAAIGITLAAIAIILILIITPELSTKPDPIDFDFVPGTGAQTFSIWNDGYRTLEWDVSSDQDWIIVSPDSGTKSGTVYVNVNSAGMDLGRHTGIITVESNGGTETGKISLVITDEPTSDAPVIHDFSAEPKHIDGQEGETTLSWEVSGATGVTINGIPVKVPAGSMIRVVGENTLFTLIATNDAGVSDVRDTKVYVGVIPSDLPIIDSFYANPADISVGGNSTLYWEVSGATKVTIDRERMDPVYGNTVVYPDITTSYELTATNEAGEADSTVTVTVTGPGGGGIVDDLAADIDDTVADLDDTIVDIDDTTVDIDDTTVDVDDTTVDLDDATVDLDDTTVDIDDTTVDIDDTIVEVDDTIVDVDDTIVDIDDTIVDIDDTTVDLDERKPALHVYPTELDFGTKTEKFTIYDRILGRDMFSNSPYESRNLRISNLGGRTLNWKVMDYRHYPDWIIIEPNYGDLTKDTVIVTVNVNIAGYKEAIKNHRQIESGIKIFSNGGVVVIPIKYPDQLNFGTIIYGENEKTPGIQDIK